MNKRYLVKAINAADNHDFNKAINYCDMSIEENPHKEGAFIVKSSILSKIQDTNGVLDCLNQGVLLNPDSQALWINKTIYESKLGLFEESIASCDKVLEINDNIPHIYCLKAESLAHLDKFDEAWDIIDFVSNKFLNFEDIYHLKALVLYLQDKDLDVALENINKFLELDSNVDNAFRLKECILEKLEGD